jgi:hypothetical protein
MCEAMTLEDSVNEYTYNYTWGSCRRDVYISIRYYVIDSTLNAVDDSVYRVVSVATPDVITDLYDYSRICHL